MLEQRQESQSISGLITRKDTDELTTGVFILRVLPPEKKNSLYKTTKQINNEKKKGAEI